MGGIKITEYKPEFQNGIDQMMLGIQAEFPISITSAQSTRINEVYQLTNQKFWVAFYEDKVVGTVGIQLFANDKAVLKRMMVDKRYRGKVNNTAGLLLEQSINWAKEKRVKELFLGTMDQFVAAQKFYLNRGFTEITLEDLPSDYHSNPIDSLYYRIHL
jgi:N-acetylglutamate synthase-like GNAT family acetyltransferase